MHYRFDAYELDSEQGQLLGPEGRIHLRPQAFRALAVLIEEAPRIVSRDELIERAWNMPFVSSATVRQTLSELRHILGDDANDPKIIRTVHRRGYRILSSVELVQEPEAKPSTIPVSAESATTTRHRLWPWALLVLTLITLVPSPRSSHLPESGWPRAALQESDSPLVIDLKNLSDDAQQDWISDAVRALLQTELEILEFTGALETLSTSSTGNRPEKALGLSRPLTVRGSFLVLPTSPQPSFNLQVQLQDTATGADLGWAKESGFVNELPQIIHRLARSIAASVGEGQIPDRSLWAQLNLASSTESLRLFAESSRLMRFSQNLAARPLLERAVTIDPDNPLHHDALAAVYANLGFRGLAAAQAVRAASLAESLPYEQRLTIAARRDEMIGNLPGASQSLRTLHHQFPNDLHYGLRLGSVLLKSGHLDEALKLTRRIKEQAAIRPLDMRPAILELQILIAGNRLREAQRAVQSLLDGDTLTPLSLELRMAGQHQLFRIHLRTGELDKARESLDQLVNLASPTSDPALQAHLLLGRGSLLGRHGAIVESAENFHRASRLFHSLGNIPSSAGALNRLAFFLENSRMHRQAVDVLEEAIALNREARHSKGLAVSLCLMASARTSQGHLSAARQALDEALALNQSMSDQRREALCLQSLAHVRMAEGHLEDAAESYRSALDLSRAIDDQAMASHAIRGLGLIAERQGRLDEAHQLLTQAATDFQALSYVPHLLGTQLQIADLLASSTPMHSRQLFYTVLQRAEQTSLVRYADLAQVGLNRLSTRSDL